MSPAAEMICIQNHVYLTCASKQIPWVKTLAQRTVLGGTKSQNEYTNIVIIYRIWTKNEFWIYSNVIQYEHRCNYMLIKFHVLQRWLQLVCRWIFILLSCYVLSWSSDIQVCLNDILSWTKNERPSPGDCTSWASSSSLNLGVVLDDNLSVAAHYGDELGLQVLPLQHSTSGESTCSSPPVPPSFWFKLWSPSCLAYYHSLLADPPPSPPAGFCNSSSTLLLSRSATS